MAIVEITVRERVATVSAAIVLVCNNPTDTIHFNFDDEWAEHDAKTARFAFEGTYIDVPFSGNEVQVPNIFHTNYVNIGVYADNLTSTYAKVACRYSVKCLGGKNSPPKEDVYDEIIKLINEQHSFDPTVYGLPTLYLTGDTSPIAESKSNKVTLEYVYGDLSGTCTLKGQGSSSYYNAQVLVAAGKAGKFNYTINFDNAFEAADGWGAHNKYCLKANWIDHTHCRNIVCAKLWGECVKSRTSGSESFARLNELVNGGAIDGFPILLSINGACVGLYTFNIPKDEWLFGMLGKNTECVLGGEKHDTVTTFYDTPTEIASDDKGWEYEVEPSDTSWVLPSLQNIYTALDMPMTTADEITAKKAALEACVEVESVIDYALMCDILGLTDNLGKNMLLVTFDGIKWMLSAYDLDTAFGNRWDGLAYIDPSDDKSGTDFTGNNLMWTISVLYATKLALRRKKLLTNVFEIGHIMKKVYDFQNSISSELLDYDSLIYPDMPGANNNGILQISDYLSKRIPLKSKDKPLIFDDTLSDASHYIWLGNIGYKEIFIKIDYPTSGIGTAQNVAININDSDASMIWNSADAMRMTVQANVSDIALQDGITKKYVCMTSAAVGGLLIMQSHSSSCIETSQNNIGWASISCSSIPAGTRIRIWGIE